MADSRQAAFGAAAVSVATPIAERVRPHVSLIALLSLGHFAIDVMQGALPALLSFVKQQHHPIAGFITAAFLPRPHPAA